MSVSFGGFNMNTATFKMTGEIAKNSPVKMSSSETVAACAGGEEFCGFAVDCGNGFASVQLCGAVTAPYTGTAPSVGYETLAGSGDKVTVSDSGREYLVIAVDTTASTVTFLM